MDFVYINLDGDTDRNERMKARAETFGIKAERFPAVKPDQVTLRFAADLPGPHRACAESHVTLWRRIVEENREYMMICEDDVVFRDGWKEIVSSGIDEIRRADPHWQCLLLNFNKPIPQLNKWTRIRNMDCLGAYVLSNLGARWLLYVFHNQFMAADAMTWHMQDLGHTYGFFPWLAVQEYFESNIQTEQHTAKDRDMRQLGLGLGGIPIGNYK